MPVTDKRLKIAGNSLIGVFARCTEKIVLVPPEAAEQDRLTLEAALKAEAVNMQISGASVLGSLIAANSSGFVVTHHAGNKDLEFLRQHGRASRLPARINAAGNVILVNDSAALVHPGLSAKACQTIEKTLGVAVEKGTIGGLKTVGMAAYATNRGLLVHPRITDSEIVLLEKVFGLPIDVGTVNMGSPLVGSGLLANSKGYLAGFETSGPELGRIEDALGFLV